MRELTRRAWHRHILGHHPALRQMPRVMRLDGRLVTRCWCLS